MQTTMTTDTKDKTDYIELFDSSKLETSPEPPNYSLCSDTLPPSLILQLSYDLKSSNNSLDMTSSLKDNTLDDDKQLNANSLLSDNKSRPLPVAKPPFYNVNNELADAKGNKPLLVNSCLKSRRSSYGDVLIAPTSPERNSYTEFNAVLDHYDVLAPVQRLNVPIENLKNSQQNANAASKKCVALAVGCTTAALLVVQAISLTTIILVRGQSDPSLGTTTMSSDKRFKEVINENVSDVKVVYAERCYCLYREQLSWQGAKDFCLTKGSGVHLAEIYTKDENDFLMPILHASSTPSGIWLGGSYLDKEGFWVWNFSRRRTEVFKPSQWALSQYPISYKESCLNVYTSDVPATFKWKDNKCTNVQPFLCKSQFIDSKCFC